MESDRPDEVSKEQREYSRRRFLRHAGVAAAAVPLYAGLAEILSEQGASAATYKRNDDNAFFASHPQYKFVMVNHVTTNPFFTASIYGCQDACAITGTKFQWTGSTKSIVSEMVSAFNTAIAGKSNGIGCCLIDNTAFNAPVDSALSHGIPVIAYNADVAPSAPNHRMAYIGQNNLTAGAAVGKQIINAGVPKGSKVGGIIATPGTGNIQPRLDGAKAVLTKAGMKVIEVGTSATVGAPEYNKIASWYAGNKDVKFMFSVDFGDSVALAEFVQKNKLQGKVGASGWDVGTQVVQGIKAGNLTFSIDQQAYLQGFDTIMQLYLYNISGGLMKPTNTDTGLGIVVKSNVDPYLAKNRFQGTSVKQQALKPPAAIPH